MVEFLPEAADIEARFNQVFEGSEVKEVFSTHYAPDNEGLSHDDPIYQQAINQAEGDISKALDLFELHLQFRDATFLLTAEYQESDTANLGDLLDQTNLIVEYTRFRMGQILTPKTDD